MLFSEAAERGAVTAAVSDRFARYGYRAVETPAVEEYATLQAGAGAALERSAFRMVDLDGSLLALRPEMTLPIARLAASRLTGETGAQRLCYAADVYREQASLRGEARQFTQLGVELLGVNGPASDAEIVCVLVDALRAAGLPDFTVGVGTVAVLRALIEAAAAGPAWADTLLAAAHSRDLVSFDAATAAAGVDPAIGEALRTVVRIAGGREAIAACRAAAGAVGCAGSLDALEATWDLLEAAGVADRVRVDFGILRSFDYYTGLILEAYAPGLGLPLGGGGRYDDVLASFGAPAPAAGFAISLERLMIALAAQSVAVPVRGLDAVVGGTPADVATIASRLREAGWRVRMTVTSDAGALCREAAAAGAACYLLASEGVARSTATGEALALDPVPAPPTLTVSEGGLDG